MSLTNNSITSIKLAPSAAGITNQISSTDIGAMIFRDCIHFPDKLQSVKEIGAAFEQRFDFGEAVCFCQS